MDVNTPQKEKIEGLVLSSFVAHEDFGLCPPLTLKKEKVSGKEKKKEKEKEGNHRFPPLSLLHYTIIIITHTGAGSGHENRIFPFRNPSITISIPPDFTIHSSL